VGRFVDNSHLEKGISMMTQAGVWIDHAQAIVVLMTNAGHEIAKFESGVAESSGKHGYASRDYIAEDRRERKLDAEHEKVYDAVLDCIRDVEAVLVLGPGEAKGELAKYIRSKTRHPITVELETTDKMTDPQLVAKVVEHFNTATAKQST
jgi:stalled ribosome rescue protein Dom34